jgi:hypothetical protein
VRWVMITCDIFASWSTVLVQMSGRGQVGVIGLGMNEIKGQRSRKEGQTSAPRLASSKAIPAPMPRDPPVTRAVLPASGR